MVLKNLLRRATRSLLTVLGIAIGVAAVVALGAMADGIAKNYGNALGVSNDLLVTQANAYDVVFSNLDEDLGQRIEARPRCDQRGSRRLRLDCDRRHALLPGLRLRAGQRRHGTLSHRRRQAGHRRPSRSPSAAAAADALKKSVDDTLRIYGVPYRIVGIYETGQGMEESGGVVTLEDAQTIAQKQRQVSLFQVGVRPTRYRSGDRAHREPGQRADRQPGQRLSRRSRAVDGQLCRALPGASPPSPF